MVFYSRSGLCPTYTGSLADHRLDTSPKGFNVFFRYGRTE